MGIEFDTTTPEGWHAALAALAWQVDLGVAEVVGDTPVDAFALPDRPEWAATKGAQAQQAAPPAGRVPANAPPAAPRISAEQEAAATHAAAVAEAEASAARATSLDALREAMAGFDKCELKRGARNLVFADGNPRARVLILGEAPGRDEDQEGRPFVGRAGQLLDRMFAAIGLSRTSPDSEAALYITNVLPWRPPANRDPTPEEIAMMRPFVLRHIELVDPALIVVMGNTPLAALTGHKGILKARGSWAVALNRPLMPMTHPAYLLRNPIAKREAWADLLAVQAKLRGG